jgi:mannose-6-phosphate isomerase
MGKLHKHCIEFEIRPWGSYQVLLDENLYKVKRIVVNPQSRLSLQKHKRRSEHWAIVCGSGIVTLGDVEFEAASGKSFDIAVGIVHRIHNTGQQDLIFIETQLGEYFGEDDIERLQDDYDRI